MGAGHFELTFSSRLEFGVN